VFLFAIIVLFVYLVVSHSFCRFLNHFISKEQSWFGKNLKYFNLPKPFVSNEISSFLKNTHNQNRTAAACSRAVEMAIIKNSKAEMIWARDKEAFYWSNASIKIDQAPENFYIRVSRFFISLGLVVYKTLGVLGETQRALLFSDPSEASEKVSPRSPLLRRVIKIKIYKHFFSLSRTAPK
jgi:hypothetical protein